VLNGHPQLYGAMWSWGEFLPFQRSRLDSRYATTTPDYRLQLPPSAYLGANIVFTTSGVFSPAAFTAAVLEVGADAIMFSVDYPYESSRAAVDGFEHTTLSPATARRSRTPTRSGS
jgi:2,3-dihydroxybenzoate decarboxylase